MMNKQQLDAIRERYEAMQQLRKIHSDWNNPAYDEFCRHAEQDMPVLLDEIQRLQSELEHEYNAILLMVKSDCDRWKSKAEALSNIAKELKLCSFCVHKQVVDNLLCTRCVVNDNGFIFNEDIGK